VSRNIKSFRKVESNEVDIGLCGKTSGDPVKKGYQGCRGRTSGTESELVREVVGVRG